MEKLMQILSDLRPDVDFKNNVNLIDGGILDSLDIVSLVGEINDTFDVEISVEHLLPENFNSVNAIMTLIEKLQD